ncbi:hypothetical protein GC169_04820 [bacterium]|nr:hypothetical protein [bacterium]
MPAPAALVRAAFLLSAVIAAASCSEAPDDLRAPHIDTIRSALVGVEPETASNTERIRFFVTDVSALDRNIAIDTKICRHDNIGSTVSACEEPGATIETTRDQINLAWMDPARLEVGVESFGFFETVGRLTLHCLPDRLCLLKERADADPELVEAAAYPCVSNEACEAARDALIALRDLDAED